MVDSAAHLVDEVLPKRPIRQWVLSVAYPLRYLFAANPKVITVGMRNWVFSALSFKSDDGFIRLLYAG